MTAPQYILPDKTPNFLDFSHQQLFRQATGYVCPNSWCQAASQAASPQLCCCSRAAGNAAFSSDSIRLSHFCPLALIEPFCWHQTKVYLGSSRTSSLSAKKNNPQTTRNSDEILTPPCQMFLGHWRDTNVRVARARARRSQLVKQISTQPTRDCQTEI